MGYIPTVASSNLKGIVSAEDKAQLNRKIFHKCLEVVLQPLKDLSHSGVQLVDPDGKSGEVFPELLVYVGDMPECKLVAGCFDSAKCEHPCEQCWCPLADLGNVSITTHRLRTESEQLANYIRMEAASPSDRKKLCKELSQHFVKCGWWGFAGGATIHCAFTGNDSLHNEVCKVFASVYSLSMQLSIKQQDFG